jgi:cell division transport system ATP-binding protein
MINDPFVLLADEPTGNLDDANTREIFRLLKKVSAGGTAVLVATHDVGIAAEFRARTLVLERGRVVEEISPAAVPPGPDLYPATVLPPPRPSPRGART